MHKHIADRMAIDPIRRTNESLDRIIAEYTRRKGRWDSEGVDQFSQLIAFAKELEPDENATVSGPSVMLIVAIGRLAGMELT